MGAVTIEQALRKGKLLLVWVPLLSMIGLIATGIAFFDMEYIPYNIIIDVSLLISAFVIPWLWWSYQVVKWKIWAFANVSDVRTLEKRVIAMQLIWPHGSWLEKTEFKSKEQKAVIDYLYHKMEVNSSKKEKVIDNNVPAELTIRLSHIAYYASAIFLALGIFLLSAGKLIIGGVGVGMAIFIAFGHYRKTEKQAFALKVNNHGIILPQITFPWSSVSQYYIQREGSGDSAKFFLVIETTQDHDEVVPLVDLNYEPFTIERYMDVYRTRYELKQLK